MKVQKPAALFAIALLMAVAACESADTEYVSAPAISVTDAVVVVPDEGGGASLSYTIKNPAEKSETTASASVSWLSGLDASTNGIVTFNASANSGAEPRTARITITYSYTIGGTKGSVSTDVTVAQSCGDQPVLSVQPTAVVAEVEGGSYSFDYSIVNPVSDGEISARSSATWISNITPYNGEVTFDVDANNAEYMRTATIELNYTYSGGVVSESVSVAQNHLGGTSGGNADISDFVGTYSCTGTVFNFAYTSNPSLAQGIEDTWTMKIYDHGDGRLLLSGLVPDTVDYYPYDDGTGSIYENGPYTAYASVTGNDIYVSVPQYTGWTASVNGSVMYIWWLTCVAYYETAEDALKDGYLYAGFYSNTTSVNIRFSYNSTTDTWTSNYGLFLGYGLNDSSITNDTFYSFQNVFAPGMTFHKTSSTTGTSSSQTNLKSLEEMANDKVRLLENNNPALDGDTHSNLLKNE